MKNTTVIRLISKIKKLIKKSSLYFPLIYMRYLFYRFIIKKNIKNYSIAGGIKINNIYENTNFFGYYNLSPTNIKGDLLFLTVNKLRNKKEILSQKINIMVKENNGSIYKVSESLAWNWQQGCMQQWYPKGGGNIIFNDYDPNKDEYISKIVDKKGRVLCLYSKPIYTVDPDGRFALTLNFERICLLRPEYGYYCKKNRSILNDEEDGIWFVDLNEGKSHLIISLEQLKKIDKSSYMQDAFHKVIHLDISPDGKKVAFLHRWKFGNTRFMRLITSSVDGNNISVLYEGSMVSHYCWLDSKRIIAFCSYSRYEDAYFEINIDTGKVILMNELPRFDGHPSISPDGKWLITDSYPDLSRMAKLYLYNLDKKYLIELGRFLQPLKFIDESRVDLHPKWFLSGYEIGIESAHYGERSLFILDLRKIICKS